VLRGAEVVKRRACARCGVFSTDDVWHVQKIYIKITTSSTLYIEALIYLEPLLSDYTVQEKTCLCTWCDFEVLFSAICWSYCSGIETIFC
jgi:hypothetical protein